MKTIYELEGKKYKFNNKKFAKQLELLKDERLECAKMHEIADEAGVVFEAVRAWKNSVSRPKYIERAFICAEKLGLDRFALLLPVDDTKKDCANAKADIGELRLMWKEEIRTVTQEILDAQLKNTVRTVTQEILDAELKNTVRTVTQEILDAELKNTVRTATQETLDAELENIVRTTLSEILPKHLEDAPSDSVIDSQNVDLNNLNQKEERSEENHPEKMSPKQISSNFYKFSIVSLLFLIPYLLIWLPYTNLNGTLWLLFFSIGLFCLLCCVEGLSVPRRLLTAMKIGSVIFVVSFISCYIGCPILLYVLQHR